jgi:hypothetical protein
VELFCFFLFLLVAPKAELVLTIFELEEMEPGGDGGLSVVSLDFLATFATDLFPRLRAGRFLLLTIRCTPFIFCKETPNYFFISFSTIFHFISLSLSLFVDNLLNGTAA